MSRPVTLPVRLSCQYSKRPALQFLRQRQPISNTSLGSPPSRQWSPKSRRAFSTTPSRRANGSMSMVRPSTQQKAQPSAKLSQKEQEAQALRSGKYPEDLGLLPDTFILPRNTADRWKWSVRKKWISTRVTEFAAWFSFRFMYILPRPKLPILSTKTIATNLHSQMYTSFAAGDLTPVQSKLASGILSSLRCRIAHRQPNTYLHWRLTKHLSAPKLVSYRAIFFPGAKDESKYERNAQVQAVVRMHTRQTLQTVRRMQKRVGGKLVVEENAVEQPQEKESVENVVVQIACRRGKWGEWTLWGFADETSAEKVEREYREGRVRKADSRARSV